MIGNINHHGPAKRFSAVPRDLPNAESASTKRRLKTPPLSKKSLKTATARLPFRERFSPENIRFAATSAVSSPRDYYSPCPYCRKTASWKYSLPRKAKAILPLLRTSLKNSAFASKKRRKTHGLSAEINIFLREFSIRKETNPTPRF